MPEKKIEIKDVKKIAKNLLLDFKELPGFKDAEVTEIWPVYSNEGKDIEYYEVKFSSHKLKDNGYTIISATTKDFPVVEFSHKGLAHFERFQDRLGRSDFRMIRFGPNYITAEDNTGKILSEIGNRPVVVPEQLQKHVRSEGKSAIGEVKLTETPEIILQRKGKKSELISYDSFKQRYRRPIIKADKLSIEWERALKTRGNPGCQYEYYSADGYDHHSYFLQINKNTPPNNNDHASGCGPTAWMNLSGWHDLNWTPKLISGSRVTNDVEIENLTMACHDFIGTYEPWFTFDADQGFTWPEDMVKGYNFVRNYFRHACNYFYRHDWWDTDEDWVFEVARDVIRAKRPFIVGYYQDWHYAIGYGVAECKTHGWKDHSWISIYPAWYPTDDSQNKWIPKGTIFAVFGVYSFFPLLQFSGIENHQELEIVVSAPSDVNRMFVYTGTAVFNSPGAIGADWLRDTISFEIGRTFVSGQFKKAIATASLASIANDDHAVNAGWAIDRVNAELAASGKIKVDLNFAIRDIDGHLLRVGYKVNVLARL